MDAFNDVLEDRDAVEEEVVDAGELLERKQDDAGECSLEVLWPTLEDRRRVLAVKMVDVVHLEVVVEELGGGVDDALVVEREAAQLAQGLLDLADWLRTFHQPVGRLRTSQMATPPIAERRIPWSNGYWYCEMSSG